MKNKKHNYVVLLKSTRCNFLTNKNKDYTIAKWRYKGVNADINEFKPILDLILIKPLKTHLDANCECDCYLSVFEYTIDDGRIKYIKENYFRIDLF